MEQRLHTTSRATWDSGISHYPAWKDVTIRSLLQMTSPIPNYSETIAIGEIEVANLQHQFSGKDLVGFVDPANGNQFPPGKGWFYSNTNYILAGLIIEAASGINYERALTTMILEPLGLHDTYYADGRHPGPASAGPVMARVPRALFLLQDCLGYQPEPCSLSTLAPLLGKDMRLQNRSWAAEAGAIISNPRDLALWTRVFEKRVIPAKQLEKMTTLVSNKTGLPLSEVSADEPAGFGLGLGRFDRKELGGAYWFYEGETLGFRTIFAYWPQYDSAYHRVGQQPAAERRRQVRSSRDRRRIHRFAAGWATGRRYQTRHKISINGPLRTACLRPTRRRLPMIFRQLFDSVSSTYSYVLASRRGGEALIIDPVLEKVDRYLKLMEELDLRLVKAVDTHLHADHITGLGALRDRTRCVTVMGEESNVDVVSMRIADGDQLTVEGLSLDVLYTPGHTDDSTASISATASLPATRCLSAAPAAPTSRTAIPAPSTRACNGSCGSPRRRWSFPPTTTRATPSHHRRGEARSIRG